MCLIGIFVQLHRKNEHTTKMLHCVYKLPIIYAIVYVVKKQ